MQVNRIHKYESSKASTRDRLTSSSEEGSVMELERRGQLEVGKAEKRKRSYWHDQPAKAYEISREEVLRAWKCVKANGGSGGIDEISLEKFENKLTKNLFTIWNQMSSGSYHPKAVKRVEIPKGDGETRPLGIPTVMDRVAQEVVRARMEGALEKLFHEDSYGYRANKSAIQAVGKCRERCWKQAWVLDVDIQKFFDTIDHELMIKAVQKHCKEKWQVLYIERWLKAPIQYSDGSQEASEKGTPQGGVISPLLANLFLHYAFDMWMQRENPELTFERYADDMVIHCKTEEQAHYIQESLKRRLEECGLQLHTEKTKVVNCQVKKRNKVTQNQFTFLGYTFCPRRSMNSKTGEISSNFLPAVSKKAEVKFRGNLRKRRVFQNTSQSISTLAKSIEPVVRGWHNYFSRFYSSALGHTIKWIDQSIASWLRRKHKLSWYKAYACLRRLIFQQPGLFWHWKHSRISRRAV